jgi:hypothetical protein
MQLIARTTATQFSVVAIMETTTFQRSNQAAESMSLEIALRGLPLDGERFDILTNWLGLRPIMPGEPYHVIWDGVAYVCPQISLIAEYIQRKVARRQRPNGRIILWHPVGCADLIYGRTKMRSDKLFDQLSMVTNAPRNLAHAAREIPFANQMLQTLVEYASEMGGNLEVGCTEIWSIEPLTLVDECAVQGHFPYFGTDLFAPATTYGSTSLTYSLFAAEFEGIFRQMKRVDWPNWTDANFIKAILREAARWTPALGDEEVPPEEDEDFLNPRD